MSRVTIIAMATLLCLVVGMRQTYSQAGQQLKQRINETQSAQRSSWQQVDQINREADNTRARLQQARENGGRAFERPTYTVKGTKIGTKGAYRNSKSVTPHPRKQK